MTCDAVEQSYNHSTKYGARADKFFTNDTTQQHVTKKNHAISVVTPQFKAFLKPVICY